MNDQLDEFYSEEENDMFDSLATVFAEIMSTIGILVIFAGTGLMDSGGNFGLATAIMGIGLAIFAISSLIIYKFDR